MIVFKNPTVLKILDYYKNLWAISYVSSVSHWDMETYMPKLGASIRGEALGRLSTIKQKMFLDKNFIKLINQVKREKLNDYEKGVIRILDDSLRFYRLVPGDFLEEFERLTSKATVVWRDAKLKGDYRIFEPYLEKIFLKNRKLSDYLGYKDSPYDALLDLYEKDLTAKEVKNFFDEIRDPLKDILENIKKSKKFKKNHFLEDLKYSKEKLEALNQKILNDLWQNFGKEGNFRLDVSSHPFTTSFSGSDTRITTWYHQKDFARSLMATIHEFGHALYDMQCSEKFEMTPIAGGSSLVLHESQSRFWENHVGRSRELIKKYIKDIRDAVDIRDLNIEDVYLYLNQVKPSLLRVEADEITYHFHIMLRAEIEQSLMEGKLKSKDLKEIWNVKMKEYLGKTPKNDSDGILQDIHWAHGSVGYFPTYSMGTFLSAQWAEAIKVGSLKSNLYKNPTLIEDWLKKNIHQYGSTYTLKDLLLKNKMKFDSGVNIRYLKDKYSKIYDF